jgi:hypothetical protein
MERQEEAETVQKLVGGDSGMVEVMALANWKMREVKAEVQRIWLC